jgi:hypothetical protein
MDAERSEAAQPAVRPVSLQVRHRILVERPGSATSMDDPAGRRQAAAGRFRSPSTRIEAWLLCPREPLLRSQIG